MEMKNKRNIGIVLVSVLILSMMFVFATSTINLSPDFSNNIDNETITEPTRTHLNISDTSPYDKLVAYWSFDSDDNITSYDLTSYNNDMDYNGNASSSKGLYGDSLFLDGNGSYLVSQSINNFDILHEESVSLAMWFKGGHQVGEHAYNFIDIEGVWQCYIQNSTDYGICSFTGSGSNGVTTGTNVMDNEWHFLVGTYNQTNNRQTIYLDGVLMDYNVQDMYNITYFDRPTYIGSTGPTTREFNGSIDEMMVFNKSLTQTEITNIYNNQSNRFKSSGDVILESSSFNSTNQDNNRVNLTLSKETNYNSSIKVSLGYCSNSSLNCSEVDNYIFKEYQEYEGNSFEYPVNTTHIRTKIKMFSNSSDGISTFYTPFLFNDSLSYLLSPPTFSLNSVSLTSANPLKNSTNHDLLGEVNVTDDNEYSIELTQIYNWYKNDSLNRTTLITDGLMAYLPLDNNVKDYYSTYDGTKVGNPILSTGKKDNSLTFNGSGQYVTFSSPIVPDGQGVTLSAWVKSSDLGTIRTIMDNGGTASADTGYLIRIGTAGVVRVYSAQGISGEPPFPTMVSSSVIDDEEWHNIIFTWNGSTDNNSVRLYVDGALEDTETAVNSTSNFNINQNMLIGRNTATDLQDFNGSIDEVMIFNRSLSEEEVYQISTSENKNVSSEYLSVGDVWKFGAKLASSSTITEEINSSEISINEATSLNIEFPFNKIVIQRNESGKGILNVKGNLSGVLPDSIDLNYEGSSSGTFVIPVNGTGHINSSVVLNEGEYNLTFIDEGTELQNVTNFGVGDVLIVNGQSNAVSNANNYEVTESPYMITSLIQTSCTTAPGEYNISDLGVDDRWSEVANNWSINEGVPVIVMNFAVGGKSISYLTDTCLPNNFVIIEEATGGSNKVKSIYWYQGEAEYTATRDEYYGKLETLVDYYFGNLTFPEGNSFVPGQLLGGPRFGSPDGIRRAIQDAWYNIDGVYRGSIMYDIRTSETEDNYTTHPDGEGLTVFDQRLNGGWFNHLAGLSKTPILENAYYYNASRLVLDINSQNLEVSMWNGTQGTIAKGIGIDTLNLTSENISSLTIKDNYVILDYSTDSLESGRNLTIGDDGTETYNETVLRDSESLIPLEIVWNETIQDMEEESKCEEIDDGFYYSSACYSSQSEACSSNGLVVSGDGCIDDSSSSGSPIFGGGSSTIDLRDSIEDSWESFISPFKEAFSTISTNVKDTLNCGAKPIAGEWSGCEEGDIATRINYICSEGTEYNWEEYTQEKDCSEFQEETKTQSVINDLFVQIKTIFQKIWDTIAFWKK